MKILFRIITTLTIILSLLLYFNLYFIMPSFIVKSDMQSFLDKEFGKKFKIINIKNNYSPDLFHQVTGYKLELEDTKGGKIDDFYLQKNSISNEWTPYQGTDIIFENLKSLSE